MATTVEQVETLLAREVGTVKEDIAALRGDVQTLTAELRLDREARARADTSYAVIHVDQENRIRALEARKTVSPMTLWTVAVSAIGAIGVIAGIVVNALK